MTSSSLNNLMKAFGPGVLFASTAIGVSHLVQSTRAGANYGFDLILFIILANLFKYPFFEYGTRYANATGKHILHGYLAKGRWILVLYFILSLGTMFTVTGAVTFVTAGLLGNLLNLKLEVYFISGIVLIICMLILSIGQYNMLDQLLKVVGGVLLVSTFIAFFAALLNGPASRVDYFQELNIGSRDSMIFIIALMGWMPTAVDLSAWNSIWAVEKIKQTGYHPKLKETLFDFNFGYIISALLSLCFLTLGAYVVYGTGIQLSDNSVEFAGQIIGLYTYTIGDWCYLIIAIAAFSTMFSTTITVLDGYSRAMNETMQLLFFSNQKEKTAGYYNYVMVIVALLSFLLISVLSGSLSQLVDLATILSFLIAPAIAIINYKVMTDETIPKQYLPAKWMRVLSIMGIAFLAFFTLIYLWVYFA